MSEGPHGQGRNGSRPEATTRRPVGIDLFAGAGGLSLGFEQAGFDVLAAVEYDPVHAATHAYNFPLAETLCADISHLETPRLLEAAERGWAAHGGQGEWDKEVDIVFGGPPCQGFSNIGRRLADDPRNQLVFHFFRLIDDLRPRYFLMENVPGMRARGHTGILEQLIKEFQDQGYRIALPYRVLNAADYGVPQDRQRLFLMGARDDQAPVHYPLPTVEAAPKRKGAQPRRAKEVTDLVLPSGPTVWEAIGDLPDLDLFEELLQDDEVVVSTADFKAWNKLARKSAYAARMRGFQSDPDDLSHPRSWDKRLLTSSTRTVHTDVSIKRFESTAPGETEPVSRFYRLDPDGLCNTLRAGTGSERGAYTSPRPIHPTLPRVLSVREAARLHSFPDWFRLHKTKWHGFRQIGNSVAPLVARAIGQSFASALNVEPAQPAASIKLGRKELLSLKMSEAAEHFEADRSQIPAARKRLAA